jgi:hypothetical protein
VSQRVLQDIRDVITRVDAEVQRAELLQSSSTRSKGSRLLYLFQRDLLPGISGQILDSKGQRDNIVTTFVSREAKIAGWVVVSLLNLGMWSYILLFALSQTVHRQGAWALSFALWLVVEVFLVSSSIVLVTHIAVPSLIMKDVTKIKQKLLENIREFNKGVRRRTYAGGVDGEGGFNAANYLFVSTRLAQRWPAVREAQIIAQFRTPWPKQSYQRENDVSESYSKRYAALYRSANVIAVFFLTQLLQVPATLQDMIIHMVTTTAVGYTVLVHVDLYEIYPVLAFVPAVCIAIGVHLYIKRSSAQSAEELCKLEIVQEDCIDKAQAVVISADEDDDFKGSHTGAAVLCDDAGESAMAIAQQSRSRGHRSRRKSVQQGLRMYDRMCLDTPIAEGANESDDSSIKSTFLSPPRREDSMRSVASDDTVRTDHAELRERVALLMRIVTAPGQQGDSQFHTPRRQDSARSNASDDSVQTENAELRERVALMMRIVTADGQYGDADYGDDDDDEGYLQDRIALLTRIVMSQREGEFAPRCSMLDNCEYLPRSSDNSSSRSGSSVVTAEMLLEALKSSRLASRVLDNISEVDENSSIFNSSNLSEETPPASVHGVSTAIPSLHLPVPVSAPPLVSAAAAATASKAAAVPEKDCSDVDSIEFSDEDDAADNEDGKASSDDGEWSDSDDSHSSVGMPIQNTKKACSPAPPVGLSGESSDSKQNQQTVGQPNTFVRQSANRGAQDESSDSFDMSDDSDESDVA